MLKGVSLRTELLNHGAHSLLEVVEIPVLEQLFDQSPDATFFVKDAEARYVSVNQSLVERHGLRRKADVIGKRSTDIGHEDFGRIPFEQDMRVIQTGKPLIDHLEMHWHRPHDPVWCLTTKLPLRDSDGTITGLVGFSRDVRVAVDRREIPVEFARALEEFEQNLSEAVTPAWLAERSGLSPQRLARLTKRLHGLTPSQLIARTRIAAASRLLRETSKPIADVALSCGFYDHSAFTRAFRSATGMTPSEFRKQ